MCPSQYGFLTKGKTEWGICCLPQLSQCSSVPSSKKNMTTRGSNMNTILTPAKVSLSSMVCIPCGSGSILGSHINQNSTEQLYIQFHIQGTGRSKGQGEHKRLTVGAFLHPNKLKFFFPLLLSSENNYHCPSLAFQLRESNRL